MDRRTDQRTDGPTDQPTDKSWKASTWPAPPGSANYIYKINTSIHPLFKIEREYLGVKVFWNGKTKAEELQVFSNVFLVKLNTKYIF